MPAAVPSDRPFDPAALLAQAFDDVRARPLAHLGAQAGFLVPLLLWFVGAQVAAYVFMVGAMLLAFAGFAAGVAADVALRHRDAVLGLLGFGVTGFLAEVGFYAAFVAMIFSLAALAAVLRFGLHRDLARQQDGGPPMGVASAFRWPFWRMGTVLLAVGLVSPLLLLGGPLALPLGVLVTFHVPTLAIRRVGTVEAARLQAAALARDPGRFLVLAFLSSLLTGFGSLVPVVGPALALAFQHRAARDVLASA